MRTVSFAKRRAIHIMLFVTLTILDLIGWMISSDIWGGGLGRKGAPEPTRGIGVPDLRNTGHLSRESSWPAEHEDDANKKRKLDVTGAARVVIPLAEVAGMCEREGAPEPTRGDRST